MCTCQGKSFPLQLGAKFLAISIVEVLGKRCIPFETNTHTRTGGTIRNRHNNKSSISSNNGKVGITKLAQSNTYLRLTQDRRMQGTMTNLIFAGI